MKESWKLYRSKESKFWQKQNSRSKNTKKEPISIKTTFAIWKTRLILEIWISDVLFKGCLEARQAQDRLQQEVSDIERALQEDRLREFSDIEAINRNHEFYVGEYSRTKLQENKNTINNLMSKVRELQYEINCMHDSKDFKDAESMHSGPLSHFPSESALFPPKMIKED